MGGPDGAFDGTQLTVLIGRLNFLEYFSRLGFEFGQFAKKVSQTDKSMAE